MTAKLIVLFALFLYSVCGQSRYDLLLTSTLSSPFHQISFKAKANGDPAGSVKSSFTLLGLNVNIFDLSSSIFHYHSDQSVDPAVEAQIRAENPENITYIERQTYSFAVNSSSAQLVWDASGNLNVTAQVRGSYKFISDVYPVVVRCASPLDEACDTIPPRYTSATFSIAISSATVGGVAQDLQSVVRQGIRNITTLAQQWSFNYKVTSRLERDEVIRSFLDYSLVPSVQARRYLFNTSVAINDNSKRAPSPSAYFWSNIKVQPVGINVQVKKCLGTPWCACCNYYYTNDPAPTGQKGMNFGIFQLNTQWAKSGVRFQILPIVYNTNVAFKIIDNATEEKAFYNSYDDKTAIEIFFARQYVKNCTNGGGRTPFMGVSYSRIVSTEIMIDECPGVDVAHLAHEMGHVFNLTHPDWTDPNANSTPNTIMCPSGYCNDNPHRNSVENGQKIVQPLIIYSLDNVYPPANDCTNLFDCGLFCPYAINCS